MKTLKYILECAGYGLLVAIVVHGMILLAAKLTTGVWLNEGGKYWYAFVASVAMFGSLYSFFDSLNKKVSNKKWYQYKYAHYILISLFVVFPAIIWGGYKWSYSGPLRLTVIAERQPLFVLETHGDIQNKYVLKLVNETDRDFHISVSATSNMQEQSIEGAENPLVVNHGKLTEYTIFIEVPEKYVTQEITPIYIKVQSIEDPAIKATYRTVFNGPKAASKN